MAREASTYRGARRNFCIRDRKMVWGPDWYYGQHRNVPDWALEKVGRNNNRPIYIQAQRVERKSRTGKGGIHELLRRGDYAGAIRKAFGGWREGSRVKASGRGE